MKDIILENIYSDKEMKTKKGHWFDEKHIKKLINYDSKIYVKKNDKLKLIAIFKKKFIPENINKIGFGLSLRKSKRNTSL